MSHERHGLLNHRQLDFAQRLFRLATKKTSKPRITGQGNRGRWPPHARAIYRQMSNIRAPNLKTWMFLVSSSSCLCPVYWCHLSSWEWRCSWSSADRRCSNYIWVINNLIAHQCAPYIRELTVYCKRFHDATLHPRRSHLTTTFHS